MVFWMLNGIFKNKITNFKGRNFYEEKVMTKLVSTAMVTTMAVGLLAGCGGNSTNAGSNAGADAGTTPTENSGSAGTGDAASSGDKVTINVTRATFNLANPDSDQVKKYRMQSTITSATRLMFRLI